MDNLYIVLGLVLGLAVAGGLWLMLSRQRRKNTNVPEEPAEPLPPTLVELLARNVPYYATLPGESQPIFANRVSQFLAEVTIEGVDTAVDDIDRVLVASSAVIPTLAFANWQYPNLTTVVLYERTFNEQYQTEGDNRRLMGQVGTGGALQSTMALSKSALRNGFMNKTSKENTGIHEFVHLLDKVDGAIDGAPDLLLPKEHLQPWLRLMHQTLQEQAAAHTDINPYGFTNEAEFFAVTAEYFFKRPDLLKTKHPDLFAHLERMFRQNPLIDEKVLADDVDVPVPEPDQPNDLAGAQDQ